MRLFQNYPENIFRNVFDFYGTLDQQGRVIDLDGLIFDQGRLDPKLLIGQKLSETVFWQSSENTSRMVEEAVAQAANGQPAKILVDFRVSADKKVAVELFLQPVSRDGAPDRIFLSGQQVARRQNRVEYYKTEIEELLFAAENADIGLWYWDLKQGKHYSTPKCNELFGTPAYDKLSFDKLIDAVHPDDRQRVTESIRKAHLHGSKYSEEFRIQYSDGLTEWLSLEGKSFLDESGKPEKMTAVVRKITEQKLADEELTRVYDREKKARDEAEEANRSKDFFLAFVSHELRSPLNAILGWSKILLTRSLDEETRRSALETIERSARSQTKLINDLVDSARVTSGKISLEFRPTNLFEVVKVSYISQKPAADSRNIVLEFDSETQEVPVFGDANRLQQVFVNLISNAIKFTESGSRVSISLLKQDDFAEVKVSDTGQGISPEALPNIFRQFSQGDPDRDVSKGGLGLGLSIVNILVGKHGGTVVAESAGVGKGATFTVRLPLKTVDRPLDPAIADAAMSDALPLRGLNVLVVEDDTDSREVLQLFLEQAGANVESHPSARSAMDRLTRPAYSIPDIIISDLAMPEEDGYSLIGRIRRLPDRAVNSLPALALSAFATNESKQRALDAGFDHYCTKPFEPDELTRDILRLTQLKLDSEAAVHI